MLTRSQSSALPKKSHAFEIDLIIFNYLTPVYGPIHVTYTPNTV